MNRNTGRTYRRAWELFLKLSGLSREEIIGMEPKKLTRLIDQAFDQTDYRAGTKRTYIHGVKSYLQEELDIETGRSRVTKLLGRGSQTFSNSISSMPGNRCSVWMINFGKNRKQRVPI